MNLKREIEIANESRNLSQVRKEVTEVLGHTPFDREMCNKIIVAVDEALANVVEHAYQGGAGVVRLVFTLDSETLKVQIQDSGVRFDPGERLSSDLDIHQHIKLGLKGGLGMFLMRRIMDEVLYNHDGPNFVNELVMIKKIPPSDSSPSETDAQERA